MLYEVITDVRRQFKKILATEYTAVASPIQYAAVAGFEVSSEIDEYFEITRNIHHIVGDYVCHAMNEIEGVKANRPDATFS